jgi:hypothetical protein
MPFISNQSTLQKICPNCLRHLITELQANKVLLQGLSTTPVPLSMPVVAYFGLLRMTPHGQFSPQFKQM